MRPREKRVVVGLVDRACIFTHLDFFSESLRYVSMSLSLLPQDPLIEIPLKP
jgi:hypothetical protein